MGYKLQRGTNGEEGYYRLSLDLPLTAHEVREIANQAIEEGWSFGDELREEIEALEAAEPGEHMTVTIGRLRLRELDETDGTDRADSAGEGQVGA